MAERGIKITEKTFRHWLSIDFGLKSYRPAQKLRLTEAMKKKAFGVCRKHLDWDTEMWKNVLFSDGSSIKQFTAQKYQVWGLPGAWYEKNLSPQ